LVFWLDRVPFGLAPYESVDQVHLTSAQALEAGQAVAHQASSAVGEELVVVASAFASSVAVDADVEGIWPFLDVVVAVVAYQVVAWAVQDAVALGFHVVVACQAGLVAYAVVGRAGLGVAEDEVAGLLDLVEFHQLGRPS
jgi:hypothetical protein